MAKRKKNTVIVISLELKGGNADRALEVIDRLLDKGLIQDAADEGFGLLLEEDEHPEIVDASVGYG